MELVLRVLGLPVDASGLLFGVSVCASIRPDVPVVSSGTPERNDANPGLADSPYAYLTGVRPRKY